MSTVTKGSCLCKEIEVQFTGEPGASALCHCTDCQKWSGGAFTSNLFVPQSDFSVTKGSPKSYKVVADSGKQNTRYFCATCGSHLWSHIEISPDNVCVKTGILDGGAAELDGKVGMEIYVKDRVSYLKEVAGAKQEQTM